MMFIKRTILPVSKAQANKGCTIALLMIDRCETLDDLSQIMIYVRLAIKQIKPFSKKRMSNLLHVFIKKQEKLLYDTN